VTKSKQPKLKLVKTDKVTVSLTLVAEILGDLCSGTWLSEEQLIKLLPNFDPAEVTMTMRHLVQLGMLSQGSDARVTTPRGLFGSEGPKQ
jgi:hypothetical protein